MKRPQTIVLFCLFILSLAISSPGLGANTDSDTQTTAAPAVESAEKPELSECIAFCAQVIEQASVLKTNIDKLPDLSEVNTSLVDLEATIKDLSSQVSELAAAVDPTYDRIFQLKSTVIAQEKAFDELTAPIETSTAKLESWKNEWQDKKDRLDTFKTLISKMQPGSAARDSLARAQEATNTSLQLISRELEKVLDVQQKGATIQARIHAMKANLNAMLSAARGQTLQKSAPSLLSTAYVAKFERSLWEDFVRGIASVKWPDRQFWQVKGWLLLLQIVLAGLIAASIFRNRHFIKKVDRWRFLIKRPLSAGLFVSIWVVGPFYGVVDRTWSFLLWAVAGVTAARLVGGLTPDHRKRFGVYVLVAIVVFIQLCRLIALPVPLFRLCIFLIALWGVAFCAWQNIKIQRQAGPRRFRWGFRLAGLVFISATLLEVAGYHILAAQLLESSLKTVLLILLGWMFVVLLEGWVKFILQTTVLDGIPRFRSNAQLIEGRLTNILSVIVFTFVTVILLVVWRVYENVGDALEGLFSIGFSVGTWTLTLGMIIIVAIALYVSFVVSWLVQGVLLEKVFPRRGVQLGVQMSMTRLIHYGIIFVGFLLALSFLGVNMKNITIIGGALGVGIGFGLQSIVSNFVSGLILLFERPIKAGDYVQLGERWGEISRVGLRSTVVRTFDRSEVVVPNSHLISNEVTNWTLTDRSIRLRLPVGVAYGSDIDKVIATLAECGRDNPTVLSNPPPQVLFMNFGESCLDFELRVWVSDIDNMVVARSEINQEIDRTFRAAGIEIAFPQRDLHLRSVDPSAALPLHRLPNEKDRESTTDIEKEAEQKGRRDE